MQFGLIQANLNPDAVQLVPISDRRAVNEMLGLRRYIDVIIPRGGRSLVDLVQTQARVPVFSHLEGICHAYVDVSADMDKAVQVILNGKTRRVEICGATECVLIHKEVADTIGQVIIAKLQAAGVEVRAQGIKGDYTAKAEDFGCEFLDKIIAVKVVDSIDQAIDHIAEYGSGHTETIIAEDASVVQSFFNRLDSAILLHNASTQFADGGEFGLGAEIGIATGKIHARGPVGCQQLTSFKYLVRPQSDKALVRD